MHKSVLITGGSGFIGNHLIKFYLNKQYRVHVVTREKSKIESELNIYTHIYDGTHQSLKSIKKITDFESTFHIAGLATYGCPIEQVDEMVDANLRFGIHLLETLKDTPCRNLINTGTYWQHYGNNENYNPVCLYAATKQAFEAIIEYYSQAYQFKVITLKLLDVYGPNDERQKLFQFLKNAMDTGKPLNMSKGDQLVDMVYIDDVINGYHIANSTLINDKKIDGFHHAYFLATNKPTTLKEIVKYYLQISKKEIDIVWGSIPYSERQILCPYIGELLPDWTPLVTLEEGISKIV